MSEIVKEGKCEETEKGQHSGLCTLLVASGGGKGWGLRRERGNE